MAQGIVKVHLPQEVYDRVRRAAKGMNQPVETALVNIVTAATPSLEKVPSQYRARLEDMEDLPDQELWDIAQSTLTPAQQRRLASLLDRNQRAKLNARDQLTLATLRTAADELMLRRSYAYVLLKYRGQRIPKPAERPL